MNEIDLYVLDLYRVIANCGFMVILECKLCILPMIYLYGDRILFAHSFENMGKNAESSLPGSARLRMICHQKQTRMMIESMVHALGGG